VVKRRFKSSQVCGRCPSKLLKQLGVRRQKDSVEKEISKVTKEIGQILAKFGVSLSGYFILYANTSLKGQINDIDSDLNTAKATDTGRLTSLKARIQRVCIPGFIIVAQFSHEKIRSPLL
jgi:hypothetical protein